MICKLRGSRVKLLKAVQKLLLPAAALLMLSSCIAQKLPYHENGYGLVAVPYQVLNQTTYGLVRAVELKSSEDDSFSIRLEAPPLNDDVVLSRPIPEGSYLVDYSVTVGVPVSGVLERGSTGRKDLTEPVRIELKDGEIALLPLLFKANQYNRAGYVICQISHEALAAERERYYLEKLPAMENGDQWRVRAVP